MNDQQNLHHFAMLNLPSAAMEFILVQDNAGSVPSCMSKTMRSYLMEAFPDLATVEEDTRWKSQPTPSSPSTNVENNNNKIDNSISNNNRQQSFRNILLPTVPKRQDSFCFENTRQSSFRNIRLPMMPIRQDSLSSCSSMGSTSTCTNTTATPPPSSRQAALPVINRRNFLVRQKSTLSLLVRQTSLRQNSCVSSKGGAGMPRMPQRQNSVTFLR